MVELLIIFRLFSKVEEEGVTMFRSPLLFKALSLSRDYLLFIIYLFLFFLILKNDHFLIDLQVKVHSKFNKKNIQFSIIFPPLFIILLNNHKKKPPAACKHNTNITICNISSFLFIKNTVKVGKILRTK